MEDGAAPLRALWLRVPLLLCCLLLPGQRDAGVGAHWTGRIEGCLFNSSDTKHWTYIDQYVYDGELIYYLDFDQRKYVAAKDWTQSNVDRWNKDGSAEAVYQGAISVCETNIPIDEREVLPRRVEPEITIRPKVSSHAGQSALLTCHVTGFYPPEIEVTWLKNGAPAPSGAINTVLLSDGDWTYQVEELLQYQPVSGDTYTCRVEHSSLAEAKALDWGPIEVQSSPKSERTKIIVGALIFVFGLLILLAGVIMKLILGGKIEVQSSPESERTKIIVGALGFVFGLLILLAGVIMKLRNAKAILDSTSHGPRLMAANVG